MLRALVVLSGFSFNPCFDGSVARGMMDLPQKGDIDGFQSLF